MPAKPKTAEPPVEAPEGAPEEKPYLLKADTANLSHQALEYFMPRANDDQKLALLTAKQDLTRYLTWLSGRAAEHATDVDADASDGPEVRLVPNRATRRARAKPAPTKRTGGGPRKRTGAPPSTT